MAVTRTGAQLKAAYADDYAALTDGTTYTADMTKVRGRITWSDGGGVQHEIDIRILQTVLDTMSAPAVDEFVQALVDNHCPV